MTDAVLVFVTVPSDEIAQVIAKALINEQAAACVSIVPGIRSIYRWEGAVCQDTEHLLLIKTTVQRFEYLKERILSTHPYQVPEIIACNIVDGNESYLSWIKTVTSKDSHNASK